MNIKTLRKYNTLLLAEEIGSLAALAAKSTVNQSYLSQCTSAKAQRSVGDEVARRLEHAMGKPRGWLDTSHMEEAHLSTARRVYEKLLAVSPSKLKAVAELLDVNLQDDDLAAASELKRDGSTPPNRAKGRVITLKDNATK